MAISLDSPNVENYAVGKGVVWIKFLDAPADADFVDIGDVSEVEFTPNIEKLDHFSSREGVKSKDRSVVLSKSGELRLVMSEMTARNLSILLMGNAVVAGNQATIDIFSTNVRVAAVRFVGANEIGPKWTVNHPRVEFSPGSSINWISEEWLTLEAKGEVLSVDGSFGTAVADFVDVIPANIVLPQIQTDGSPAVGETLTAFVGVWSGSPATYTYQWKNATVAISGATNPTYIPVAGDSGDSITVTVTAHNGGGNVAATSPAVVIA
jgi:hypothetical protein